MNDPLGNNNPSGKNISGINTPGKNISGNNTPGKSNFNRNKANQNKANQNKANTIKVILENLATLEKEEYPNWRNIVRLQSELVKILSETLNEQKKEFLSIQTKLTTMEKRLETETIPISDMETLANILKPFLAKTYQNNKKNLNK